MSCQTRNGTRLSKSGYYSKRAGLFHLYRIYGKKQTEEFQEDMKGLFKGFLRTVAQEVQNGQGRISTGKLPLSFELYSDLCRWMYEDSSAAGRFAHLFLVLSWNLACRSSNTKTIHYHHLAWNQDSLQIYFAHMKNDQTGERPRDPRHVYANPYNPAICPILTLITYLLVTPPSADTALFPGTQQYNRYNKYLRALLERKREYIMRNYGIDVSDIGAHSARKGASTYLTSGCICGPMQQAVNIRCGWVMIGVTDTYCRYEAAGDQYCGRVVSGLPLFSFRFGVLPPRFKLQTDTEKEALDRLVLTLFPELNTELWSIVKFGLASLALRENWLKETLAADHCIFQSSVFWNTDYHTIKSKVKIELGVGDTNLEVDQIRTDDLTCTGIPSHTVLLASQRNVVLQQRELIKKHEDIPDMIQTAIAESGLAPNRDFRDAVNELKTLINDDFLGRLQGLQVADRNDEQEQVDRGPRVNRVNLHYHNGRYIRIPPSFIFPTKCSLRDIFFRYHLKDEINDVPPLKLVDCNSVAHIKRGKGTLSDMKYLMCILEDECVRQEVSTSRLQTQQEASEAFEKVKHAVYKHDTRSKRKETLKWQTWVQKCRKAGVRRVLLENV